MSPNLHLFLLWIFFPGPPYWSGQSQKSSDLPAEPCTFLNACMSRWDNCTLPFFASSKIHCWPLHSSFPSLSDSSQVLITWKVNVDGQKPPTYVSAYQNEMHCIENSRPTYTTNQLPNRCFLVIITPQKAELFKYKSYFCFVIYSMNSINLQELPAPTGMMKLSEEHCWWFLGLFFRIGRS